VIRGQKKILGDELIGISQFLYLDLVIFFLFLS